MEPMNFEIDIAPHRAVRDGKERTVYDIHVHEVANDNLLVFSNQGYENRHEAFDLAVKLFSGRPAELRLFNADGEVEKTYLMVSFI